MKKYLTGFICGILIGAAGSVFAARFVGGNGYLIGWDVSVNGEDVCTDPYIWVATREIECN